MSSTPHKLALSHVVNERHRSRSTRRHAFVGIVLAASMSVLAGISVPQQALAVHTCGGVSDTCQCGRANFCICCDWSGQSGNCVWWAWHKACCNWAIALQWCTNANTFDNYARDNGYPVRSEACENTIMVCEANVSGCSGGYGHVAWVEEAFPNGSIDVTEQGCYSWNGVRSRNLAAQNLSPRPTYIYKPGTSCRQCECDPGQTQEQNCGNCGRKTRRCNSECQWGGWSGCEGGGPCNPGASETQDCGSCGTRSRSCRDNCQWRAWSDCQGEGECASGETASCGLCGSKTCSDECAWGDCMEAGECEAGEARRCGNCGMQSCSDECLWGICQGEGSCSSGEIEACGERGTRTCGDDCQWSTCDESSACSPGEARECGNCGQQLCGPDRRWSVCEHEGDCRVGEQRSCGDAYVETCGDDCRWGECGAGDSCTPGDELSCGNCGQKTCDASGRWSHCRDEGMCEQGSTRACGTNHVQVCGPDCHWGDCVASVSVPDEDAYSEGARPESNAQAMSGGCGCRQGGAPVNWAGIAWWIPLGLMLIVVARRRSGLDDGPGRCARRRAHIEDIRG